MRVHGLLLRLEFPRCGNKLQDNKAATNNGTSDGRFLVTTKGSVVFNEGSVVLIEGSVSGHLIAMLHCSGYISTQLGYRYFMIC